MAEPKEQSGGDIVVKVASFEECWEVFKHRQTELSALSKAFVEETRTAVADVNGKKMIFDGVGYAHADIKKLLSAVGAAFNPQYVANPPPPGAKHKEYSLSVRYPWAQDRVM